MLSAYQATSEEMLALRTISGEKINLMIHSTGDKELDVKSLLSLVQNILPTAGTAAGLQPEEPWENMKFEPCKPNFKSPLCTLKQISCELMACKAQGEAIHNVDKKTEAILKVLSVYSVEAKLVLSLAALALEFGEFWRLRKDLKTSSENNNSQEKEFFQAMAILKSVTWPQYLESQNEQALTELNALIYLIVKVTRTIFELGYYYSVSQLSRVIGNHGYQTVTTIVACATQISILKNNEGQLQDLSQRTSHLSSIYKDLQKHKRFCQQQKELDIYKRIISMLEYTRPESDDVVVEILKMIIYAEVDVQKLLVGGSSTHEEVDMDVLRRKDVFLLISSLDISEDVISSLRSIHGGVYCNHFKIVWIPIVEKWTSELKNAFLEKKRQMPWYIVQVASIIAGIRFIKDEWKFNGKPIVVHMTANGNVETLNALNLIRLKGIDAFPFTKNNEKSIQGEKNWLHLIAEKHHPSTIKNWVQQGNCIFFYGGTDLVWIKKFKSKVEEVAGRLEDSSGANGSIKWLLIGKKVESQGEDDPNVIGNEDLFWTHIESLHSLKLRKEVDSTTTTTDETQESLQKLLSFKTESRWAVLSKGSEELIADHGTIIMRVLKKLPHNVDIKQFYTTFKNYRSIMSTFAKL